MPTWNFDRSDDPGHRVICAVVLHGLTLIGADNECLDYSRLNIDKCPLSD